MMELQNIFKVTSNEMEWEKYNEDALVELTEEQGFGSVHQTREWAMKRTTS